ncbi:MAG TPA: carboxypeptidase-like regulatory domain-containing protein [Bacteroidales bacterium]|nr:carboxypeptidase-like regulatory domain-containing protein [Bacteroidales bacterium]HQI69670.1 carboxypeptidase-like regulatory domain-containing protein [Bacteroidales bacterium]
MLKPLKKVFYLSFFLYFLLSSEFVASQVISDTTLVQFSGIVITADSLKPIPFVNILIKDTWRGTVTDLYGFFSFVAHPKDVVVFNALGYKTVFFTIPDTLTINRYSLIQVLRPDTLLMNETVIYPWPTYEQFKQAFVNTDIPDDELERAKKNIEELEKRILFDEVPMSSAMNYRNYIDTKVSQLYYAGQYRPNNLLNPFAWAQFIKAWREGKFKVKKQGD